MEEKYMIIDLFEYEFFNALGEKVGKIISNTASKYTFNSKEKERLMTIENVLFDEEMLALTMSDLVYTEKFTVKCHTKVIHCDTNEEKDMFMFFHNVKIRGYEIGVVQNQGIGNTFPNGKQDKVRVVLELNGKDGEVEIKDKQAE